MARGHARVAERGLFNFGLRGMKRVFAELFFVSGTSTTTHRAEKPRRPTQFILLLLTMPEREHTR